MSCVRKPADARARFPLISDGAAAFPVRVTPSVVIVQTFAIARTGHLESAGRGR